MGPAHEPKEDRSSPPAEPCVELPLLLSSQQLTALERAAFREGVTVGALLRGLIRSYLESAPARQEDNAEVVRRQHWLPELWGRSR